MARRSLLAAGLAGALLVSACAPSPEEYETEPVQVETAQGVVTCQLYQKNLVVWDRAIDRPASMSVKDGDAICKAEGQRRKDA